MPKTEKVVEQKVVEEVLVNREDEIRKRLINDLEMTSEMLSGDMKSLGNISPKVLRMLDKAIDDQSITPYKAAVAYSKCVDSVVKMANARMGLFDRLSGTIGAYGTNLEERDAEEIDNPPIEVQREAERTIFAMVKEEVERKKALKLEQERKQQEAS